MDPIPKNDQHLKAQFKLRIDQDLLDWLKEQAAENDRPVNYIINHALKQFRKHQEQKQ